MKRSTVPVPSMVRADRSERLRLSFAQQRLWFLTQMEGVSEAYHISFGLRLTGELDRAALVRALDRMVARHEVQSTTFVLVDGETGTADCKCRRESLPSNWLPTTSGDSKDAKAELEHLVAQRVLYALQS